MYSGCSGEAARCVTGLGNFQLPVMTFFLNQTQGHTADNLQPVLCQQLQLVPERGEPGGADSSHCSAKQPCPEHFREENSSPASALRH